MQQQNVQQQQSITNSDIVRQGVTDGQTVKTTPEDAATH